MIGTIPWTDLPFTSEQIAESMAVVAAEIRMRYRSNFTLVVVLPESKESGALLIECLENDKALFTVASVGVQRVTKDGKPAMTIIDPPSVHLIKNRKVVVFDAPGDWQSTYNVCDYIKKMKPSSIEVAAMISRGPVPKWVNRDYVAFEVVPREIAEPVVAEEVPVG